MAGMELSRPRENYDQETLETAARSAPIPNAFAAMSFGSNLQSGMQMMAIGGSKFFECPIDVPFCERTYCVPPNLNSNVEYNAFSCYSQPGCCFDQTLYQYRVAFGPN